MALTWTIAAFMIMAWGVLLMAQASVKKFADLIALRIVSGAAEAIADPAFMLFTTVRVISLCLGRFR